MAPISAKTTNSLKDLQEGYQLFLKADHFPRCVLSFTGGILIFNSLYWLLLQTGRAHFEWTGAFHIPTPVFLALLWWDDFWIFLKRPWLKKHRDFTQNLTWEFSEAGISRTHDEHSELMSWWQPRRILAHPQGMILCMGLGRFHYIPSRAFPTRKDFQKIRACARTRAADFKELS
ncbi:MAG: hypothetical protein QM680_04300 [Luteolibacter sp.]